MKLITLLLKKWPDSLLLNVPQIENRDHDIFYRIELLRHYYPFAAGKKMISG